MRFGARLLELRAVGRDGVWLLSLSWLPPEAGDPYVVLKALEPLVPGGTGR